jgi:molybdopterin converting factor subunit 1
MITVTIRLFAIVRERARVSELRREFPDGTTVAEIWQHLKWEFPALDGVHEAVGFAVNQEYVDGSYRLRAGDEVAFIPPVSGGAGDPQWVGPIRIVREPVDFAALEREVAARSAGAICTFRGTTRESNAGRNVIRLEYEAYEPMALSEMRKLAVRAGERWPITRIAIVHRVGLVNVGETSVAIAVAAPHRAEAFAACRFAIDRLKEVVPIWKKEYFEGGEIWVGCQTSHPPHPGALR